MSYRAKSLEAMENRSLYWYRRLLIDERNEHVDRPFYLWRKKLHEKVRLVDREIEKVDEEINLRRGHWGCECYRMICRCHGGDRSYDFK